MLYTTTRKQLLLWLCTIFFLFLGNRHHAVSQESTPRTSSIEATHESTILLIAQHKQHIYSLDNYSLLKIQEKKTTHSKQDTTQTIFIGKEQLNRAYFHYPFIITETVQNSLVFYNIIEQKNLYTFPSDGHSFALSNDSTLFAFSYRSHIVIINLVERTILNSIPFNTSTPPLFMTLASNNKNIMIYYSDGTIEYLQISTAKILQKAKNNNKLLALTLNKSRRYIIGHNDTNLLSIDAVNGNTISNYFFTDTVQQIQISQSTNTVLVVSENSQAAQTISFYTILKNGRLILDDNFQISGLKKISTISEGDETTVFIGKTDGSILSYNRTDSIFSLLYPNTTQAIYDASIFNDSLVIAKSDSLIHLPLDNIITIQNTQNYSNTKETHTTYREIEYTPTILLQYENPRFIRPHTLTEYSKNSMYILSQNPLNPLLYTFNKEFTLIKADTLQFIPDLVFIPQNDHMLYYQEQSAFLVSRTHTNETNVILDTNQLIYSLQYPIYAKEASYANPVLWLNTPINQRKNAHTVSTDLQLWAYPLKNIQQLSPSSSVTSNTDNSNNNAIVSQNNTANTISNSTQTDTDIYTIQFPFNSKEIIYIQAIHTSPHNSFFLINKTPSHNRNEQTDTITNNTFQFSYQNFSLSPSRYTVHIATKKHTQQNNSDTNALFTLINTPLATIDHDDIVYVLPYGDSHESLLLFTKNYIQIITIDIATLSLSFDTRMKYPDNFSILRNVGVYDNYIVMVDTHNTLIMLEIQNNTIQNRAKLFLSERTIHIKEYM